MELTEDKFQELMTSAVSQGVTEAMQKLPAINAAGVAVSRHHVSCLWDREYYFFQHRGLFCIKIP